MRTTGTSGNNIPTARASIVVLNYRKSLMNGTKTASKLAPSASFSSGSGISSVIAGCHTQMTAEFNSSIPETGGSIDISKDDFLSELHPPYPRLCAYHDCHSLASAWGIGPPTTSLEAARPTGASQAQSPSEDDPGDGKSNELVVSCPAFRNELGNEPVRKLALCRDTQQTATGQPFDENSIQTWHREHTAAEAGVLEDVSNVYLGGRLCATRQTNVVIEPQDVGSYYFRHCFAGRAHVNYFGTDDQLGPVAVSMVRETTDRKGANAIFYRMIIRISDLLTMRVAVPDEALPEMNQERNARALIRDLLELICPQIHFGCLRPAVVTSKVEDLLVKIDEQPIYTRYKVGVLYCRAGQSTEEQMYNNENSSPAFDEFLDFLGSRVRLKNFESYKGGLDTRGDTTGEYSIYTEFHSHEIMFHVSTMLPFTPNNKQQLSRKRHIGNDMVTIIFQEPDALPFSPITVRSHFQHVFIIVRVNNPCTDNVSYSVALSRAKDVPAFGPPISGNILYQKCSEFHDFLLTKIINAENAVHRSKKFAAMAARTRREALKDLAENHVTTHSNEGPSRIASRFLGGSVKRKERQMPKLVLNASIRGALSWMVDVLDHTSNQHIGCILGLSVDNFVLLDVSSGAALFATSTHSILGWANTEAGLKIFYDHGDMLLLRCCSNGPTMSIETELNSLLRRLESVTNGEEGKELILRRGGPKTSTAGNVISSLSGGGDASLGFHIQEEGIVTDVEMYQTAWKAGLRQGSRIVEIDGRAMITLRLDQMRALFEERSQIRIIMIAPTADGNPRRGCEDPNCPVVKTANRSSKNAPESISSPMLSALNTRITTDFNTNVFETRTNIDMIKDDFSSEWHPPYPRLCAYHDCHSLASAWGIGPPTTSLEAARPTGASQAQSPSEDDPGDGKSNELVVSCPAFRNELGNEPVRKLALCRDTQQTATGQPFDENSIQTWHREHTAAEAGVLEDVSNVYLGGRLCATRQTNVVIEPQDVGSYYFRHCFAGRAHVNYFGTDDQLGPVAVSMVRETTDRKGANAIFYRMIIRISDLLTMRVAVPDEALPEMNQERNARALIRDLLELICPQIHFGCLRPAVVTSKVEDLLVKIDEQPIYTRYKVGVLYCRAGQSTEEQMYNNENSSPAFDEFLDFLGSRVRLKNFESYKGGLDTRGDTTGEYSIYTEFHSHEIMFHVSTMLPFTPNNKQQLSRKRHIGNDMVTIIFQEPDALPFSPITVRSHFQHVFIIVRVNNPCTDNVSYSVALSRAKDVPAFGPPISGNILYQKCSEFHDFLLTKIINAENAVHRSKKFAAMAARTRREALKDLAENHVTTHSNEGPSRIASRFLGGSVKRKERQMPKLVLNASIRGALSWMVDVLDHTSNQHIGCILGLSVDNFVLLDVSSGAALFATSTHSILGWANTEAGLKIFYDHGDMLLLRCCSNGPTMSIETELNSLLRRLESVTNGEEGKELILRRGGPKTSTAGNVISSLSGGGDASLGFHIQEEGIVTDVEMYQTAWKAGLRQGSRIVEIDGRAMITLRLDQMRALFEERSQIRIIMIAPTADGNPRRGCEDPNCSVVKSVSRANKNIVEPIYSERFLSTYPIDQPELMDLTEEFL